MQMNNPNYLENNIIMDEAIELSEKERLGDFSFLDVNTKVNSFKYKVYQDNTTSSSFNFIQDKSQFSLILFCTVESDNQATSRKLQETLNSIYQSLPELEKVGVTNKNILICLFFLRFSSERTFKQLFPYLDYLSSCCAGDPDFNCGSLYCLSSAGIPISLLGFNKNYSTKVECLKLFYLYVLNDLHFNNLKTDLNVIIFENGMIPTSIAMRQCIQVAKEVNVNIVPSINLCPKNLWGDITQFDSFFDEMINMYYFDITSSCPLDHRFYYSKISKDIYEVCKEYFKYDILYDAGINYHDYKFGLYLRDNEIETCFIKEIEVTYSNDDISFNDIMTQYSDKKGGYFLLFFSLVTSLFLNCAHLQTFNFIKKVFLFFQISEILFEFIKPATTILLSFCIFSEAFSNEDSRLVIFFVILYVLFFICACCFSLISPIQSGKDKTFILLNVLFHLYFFFLIISGIIALYYIKINNTHDKYIFNYVPVVIFVIVNVVFMAVPTFLSFRKFSNNIKRLFKYFFVAYPSYIFVFSFHALVNFTDQYGHVEKENGDSKISVLNERKKIFVLLFLLTNCFFSFLCFFLTTRTIRVDCFFALAIIFTTFQGIRMIAIIISTSKLEVKKVRIQKSYKIPMILPGIEADFTTRKTLKSVETKDSVKKSVTSKMTVEEEEEKKDLNLISTKLTGREDKKSAVTGSVMRNDTKSKHNVNVSHLDRESNDDTLRPEDFEKEFILEVKDEIVNEKIKRKSRRAQTTLHKTPFNIKK